MQFNIVHCKKSKFDIYIGRNPQHPFAHFGNPFGFESHDSKHVQCVVKTRTQAIDCFKLWLYEIDYIDIEPIRRKWILNNIHKLNNKVLGCWCNYPQQDCHGRIYIERLQQIQYENQWSLYV